MGLIGAFGVTRVVRSLLIGVSPTDPLSFISVPIFLYSPMGMQFITLEPPFGLDLNVFLFFLASAA